MKNQLILFLLVFAFTSQSMAGQERVRFRRIPKKALEQTVHHSDAEAEAAILHQSCTRTFRYNRSIGGFQLHTKIHQRRKIYTQEGQSWGDFEIPYLSDGNFARFRAYTYNLTDGKEEEIRLSNSDIYTEDRSEYVKLRRFAMPAVVAGSVIDIEYELVEPARSSLQPFVKQYSIPVDYSEYTVEIPEYYVFNKATKGLPIGIKVNNSSYGEGETFFDSSGNSFRLSFTVYKDQYVAQNIPALRPEPFVPLMDNYRSTITYELSSIRRPQERVINVARTWGDITKSLMENRNFGGQITTRIRDLEPFLEEVMELEESERIEKIYYFVRDNHEWNRHYGELAQNGVRQLVSDKSGNIGDINLLLINLLKKADIDVYPVVLSSRHNGFLNIMYPTYLQLNYLIAAIQTEEDLLFLDATHKSMMPGYLPTRALNLDGIFINNDYTAKRIEISNPNKGTLQVYALAQLEDDMTINGNARITYTDFYCVNKRAQFRSLNNHDEYIKDLTTRHPQMEILSFNIQEHDTISNRVIENLEFKCDGFTEKIGDMVYISPMLIWQVTESPFKSESREFPVFYPDSGVETYIISFQIPETYNVESLPDPVRMILPENIGELIYTVNNLGNTIQIQYRYTRNESIVSPLHYEYLREFMIHKVDKLNEKIVLRTI